jgi:thiamine biosynthesis lipoprotein ApbE
MMIDVLAGQNHFKSAFTTIDKQIQRLWRELRERESTYTKRASLNLINQHQSTTFIKSQKLEQREAMPIPYHGRV